jgi:hypothetical protein
MGKFTGSCSCGDLKYEVDGDIKSIVNCHCNICRKMNGSAFSTYVAVSDDNFSILSGNLKTHQITEHARKNFCEKCGTPIYNSNPKYAGLKILHLGSLDESPAMDPVANIYCESQIDWLDRLSDISRLQQGF